jgi:hypothetical protein
VVLPQQSRVNIISRKVSKPSIRLPVKRFWDNVATARSLPTETDFVVQ